MKKFNLLLIGLLFVSVVVMSGCTDNKASDYKASNSTVPPTGGDLANNPVNKMPSNSTMPPGGGNPDNMLSNSSTSPRGNPGNMSSNFSMPPGGNPGNMPSNSTIPPAGGNQS